MRTILVWRAAMSECSVWIRRMRPSAEVQSSARDRKSKRVRVRSIGMYSVRADGRDRERLAAGVLHIHRTVYRSQIQACQASSVDAVTEHGETTVRQELIAHLDSLNRRRARGYSTSRRSAEIHVFGMSIFLW